ncbi:MAG: Spy/CpxP family protein refolding chaperone [Aquaticitalea sp.]
MKKNTILYILLAFLIVANGFFLVNYLGRPQADDRKGPGDFIVKELKFNESQMKEFQKISDKHHNKMKVIFDNERHLKDELFSKISESSVDETVIDSIVALIGDNGKSKDKTTFYFFKEIESISNEEQKEKLDKLIHGALRGEGKPDGPPPPPKRD